jgi:hypothetical protein
MLRLLCSNSLADIFPGNSTDERPNVISANKLPDDRNTDDRHSDQNTIKYTNGDSDPKSNAGSFKVPYVITVGRLCSEVRNWRF